MPLKCLPTTFTRCLGLSQPGDSSPSPGTSSRMAREMTRAGHVLPDSDEPGTSQSPIYARVRKPTRLPACAARDPAVACGEAGASSEIPNTIRLWGQYDPAPDWAAPTDAQGWADFYKVNTAKLIDIDGRCTRYGLIELGGFRFIVGPTAASREAGALTAILEAHTQIGAVFSVEPWTPPADSLSGARGEAGKSDRRSGYQEKPIGAYIARIQRASDPARTGAAAPSSSSSGARPVSLAGGLSHVKFMEFEGMAHHNTVIAGRTLWEAGRGVAEFMRHNPGKIALVCSTNGIARPSAVIASAALQLTNGDAALRAAISDAVVTQRSEESARHIDAASDSFDNIAELASLISMLRRPGRGDEAQERKVYLLMQRLETLMTKPNADVTWRSREGRCKVADIFEAHFEHVAPLLASAGLPIGTALLWLGGEMRVSGVLRFLTPGYVERHLDRISLQPIDPEDPNAVRLVSLDDRDLVCDNKYYDVASVADWYRQCKRSGRADGMTNPISRVPVIALLVRASERARLAPQFLPSSV